MYKKFYYAEDYNIGLKEIVEKYFEMKKKDKGFKFVYCIKKEAFNDEQYLLKVKKTVEKLTKLGLQAQDIIISVEGEEHKYFSDQWERVRETENYLAKHNISFGFEDMHKTWSVKEVKKANGEITKIANDIKKQNYSPYEKLCHTYLAVANRKYRHEKEDEHFSQSRSVFGLLNSDRVVCVGYSQLAVAINNELGDENIKLYNNSVSTSDDGLTKRAGHSCLIAYIKDEKYGIDGYYYLDPTNDNFSGKRVPTLNFFMIPLERIKDICNPYIKDRLLPATKTTEHAASKLPGDSIYYSRKQMHLSFSGDGLVVSSKFLQDLVNHPRLNSRLKKRYIDLKYKENEENYKSLSLKKERIEQIKEIFSGISLALNEKEAFTLSLKIDEALQMGDYNILKAYRKELEAQEFSPFNGQTLMEIITKKEDAIRGAQDLMLYMFESLERLIEQKDMFDEVGQNYRNYSDLIKDFYKETSAEVPIEKTMNALRVVLKNVCPKKNDQQISQIIHQIFLKTADYREDSFDDAYDDQFVKYSQAMKFEEEIEEE
ncbi:MAG: hypothetical protein IJZ62_02720 [Clostridia bacterium]|nr:hypothetical protein [Clostridia bacterium]